MVVGQLVIHWIHLGADGSGRSRRQTPGRTVSSVAEGDGLTKTCALVLPFATAVRSPRLDCYKPGMILEAKVALTASGTFFLVALLTGIWKYRHMLLNDGHVAPVYVDVAHRAALLYAFAALLLARLVEESPFSPTVNLFAIGGPLLFFAVAIASYVGLGFENRTDNQFRERNFNTTWGMAALIVAEIGGFGVLFVGFLLRAWWGW